MNSIFKIPLEVTLAIYWENTSFLFLCAQMAQGSEDLVTVLLSLIESLLVYSIISESIFTSCTSQTNFHQVLVLLKFISLYLFILSSSILSYGIILFLESMGYFCCISLACFTYLYYTSSVTIWLLSFSIIQKEKKKRKGTAI